MDWHGWFSLGLAGAALLLMSSGRFAPHLVMMAALVVLSASGIIGPEQALAGFSNPGLITVVALFVVASGVHHSGGVDLLVHYILGSPKTVRGAQARIALPVTLLSGFLNNTPVVATMIPAVHAWSRKIGIAPSKLMIPLSYAAIFGGTLTLIGTSTNLVVNGQYQQLTGEEGFSIFAITQVGLPVAIIGVAVMLLVLPRMLPDRKDQQKFGSVKEFTLEVAVAFEGPLVGKSVGEAGLRELDRLYLVEIERDGSVVTAVPSEERLRGGDRLVFAGDTQAISDLLRINGIVPSVHDDEPSLSKDRAERRLVEAVLSPQSDVLGQTIRDARFRDRYGAVVLAVARGGERVPGNLGNIRLKPGDVLLLEARPAFVSRQRYNKDFLLINDLETEAPRHDRAWLSWGILLVLVGLAACGIMTMLNAALVGAFMMILSGCCSVGQAQKAVDVPVILTIAASFALGGALEQTGAASYLAGAVFSLSDGNTLLALLLVYLVVSVLTEVITNNAAAVLIVPVVLSLTSAMGVDSEPFIIAVMMAASASFATPLGYQTNMMVFGPGGYRFSDFVRVGLPMNVFIGLVTVGVISVVYSV
ncbi:MULTISPECIES: SLC13 family permease [unclassified Marinobacter]|uniref:SLC13 family permease n=1 Tax=unclassified Marinobacter TaxID=83889 RepID=UPI000718ADE7|nr:MULTISPECIES: SLC13 family permease [unclassified Marinobacter]AMQ88138.1 potassium transporter TrkA [Marinobacter sp. LQ44]MDX5335088.1 SLC13 family permease [Marinobacter sp.]MDX5385848.1 SLC13 family permease [Marinobacter sp.]MDX5471398.1 SLC13 family permease [Marinobacter sp.]